MQNTNSLNSLPTKENSPKLSFSVLETENENGIQIHKETSPKKVIFVNIVISLFQL